MAENTIIQGVDVMLATIDMGRNAEWYDVESAENIDGDEAWFSVHIMQDPTGQMWDGQEISRVVGGPFATPDEALAFAEKCLI